MTYIVLTAPADRYFTEDMVDPIAVTAGLVQTALYLDFFYVYFTKCVCSSCIRILKLTTRAAQGVARTEVRATCMNPHVPKIMYCVCSLLFRTMRDIHEHETVARGTETAREVLRCYALQANDPR